MNKILISTVLIGGLALAGCMTVGKYATQEQCRVDGSWYENCTIYPTESQRQRIQGLSPQERAVLFKQLLQQGQLQLYVPLWGQPGGPFYQLPFHLQPLPYFNQEPTFQLPPQQPLSAPYSPPIRCKDRIYRQGC